MNVTQMLKQKGSTKVETVEPHTTVAEAAAVLSERRIGAVVVRGPGGEIAGIVSERDIVRMLGRDGAAVLTQPVTSLMTARVETCTLRDTTSSVMERMSHGRFRHMPVVEGGQMVGLLSIGDVVKARIAEIEHDNQAMAGMLSG